MQQIVQKKCARENLALDWQTPPCISDPAMQSFNVEMPQTIEKQHEKGVSAARNGQRVGGVRIDQPSLFLEAHLDFGRNPTRSLLSSSTEAEKVSIAAREAQFAPLKGDPLSYLPKSKLSPGQKKIREREDRKSGLVEVKVIQQSQILTQIAVEEATILCCLQMIFTRRQVRGESSRESILRILPKRPSSC